MLRSLDIEPGMMPQLRASATLVIDLRNPLGKAITSGGSILNGQVKFDVPDHIEYVAGIRFHSVFTARWILPAQTIAMLDAAKVTCTLKEPDSRIVIDQIPIIRLMPALGQVGYHAGVSPWTDLWFAPGILIDPRQSYITTWAKGIVRSVPYQFLYW